MRPIRVLVVDDTVVVRRLVSQVLDDCPDIEVVGTASHGRIALQQIDTLQPDVVTLDVEMPVMDGLATLAELRPRWPELPVIMFSTLTERGATATLEALALGASDYVTKPSHMSDRAAAVEAVRSALVPLVRVWGRPRPTASTVSLPRPPRVAIGGSAPLGVVIGVSTGGPNALSRVIPALPASLSVPVVVVQHMPPVFTRLLAERLNSMSAVTVSEAADGVRALPGHVYVAAGGQHLRLETSRGVVTLHHDDGPVENSCKPAVDVTLRSAAEVWGSRALVAILTGMGYDGLEGSRAVRARGGRVLAQDEATSVVWGMPGAVVRGGLADDVLPLDEVAPAIVAAAMGAPALSGMGSR